MTASPRCRPVQSLGRARLERVLRQEESPEVLLLSLGAELRQLSADRPFRQELLLLEQVFVLLLAGFRPQPLPGARVGLLPPPPGSMGSSAPATVLEQAIAVLLQSGMDWVEVAGLPPLLRFPAPADRPERSGR